MYRPARLLESGILLTAIAAVLLNLIARGPGALSVDHWLARRHGAPG